MFVWRYSLKGKCKLLYPSHLTPPVPGYYGANKIQYVLKEGELHGFNGDSDYSRLEMACLLPGHNSACVFSGESGFVYRGADCVPQKEGVIL